MFLVQLLKETIEMEILGVTRTTQLCFSKGMIGALPVFAKREDAVRYAGREDLVKEISQEGKRIVH